MEDTKIQTTLHQFLKFAIIGLFNTALDAGILYFLSYATGITKGDGIIPLNAISFAIATTNSYFLNKFWAFADKAQTGQARKFSLFLLVSIIGVTINTSVVWLISTYVPPQLGLESRQWLIFAKLAATGVSLVWNFIGYKLVVFRK